MDRIDCYPAAREADVVDDYHGTRVADPYRWLENADEPETAAWVAAQNRLTASFLAGPEREAIKQRLEHLFDYPRVSVPERHAGLIFYSRNTGLQNHSVVYVREGQDGPERVLLDPNELSPDGTVALTAISVTRDGSLMAYTLSKSGSDRQEIFVRDVASGRDLPDRLLWAKFTNLSWTPDRKGFFYTRFPEPGTLAAGDESYYARVYYHALDEPQEQDPLVYERPEQRELFCQGVATRDGRFLLLLVSQGSSDKSEVFVRDLATPGAPIRPVFTGFADAWTFVDELDGRFFFLTDKDAPLGRMMAVDLGRGETEPVEVLAEGRDKLEAAAIVSRKLVALRLRNASSRVELHSLEGKALRAIELPTLGSVVGLSGEPEDDEMFLGFTSFTYPATPFRYEFKTGVLAPFEKAASRIDSAAYEVDQVFCTSKDGTKVSMFLVHKKGLPRDGARPTLLYGYGGFNISLTPAFSSARFVWLDRGGILAIANLRGGGEYGEDWHQAGMLDRKQNVFDDFIAAAEWLSTSGFTTREKLAIEGGSNGGLLVGAVMTQRPELAAAVVCQVPVADMLRYHLFTVGRFWIPEYGSSDDPRLFPVLYRYSPLHNVKDGVAYPATLILTADTDDRVAPGMAKKLAARLQAAQAGARPILIRVETKAGHGAGKPISKQIDEQADTYRFLLKTLGEEGGSPSARITVAAGA